LTTAPPDNGTLQSLGYVYATSWSDKVCQVLYAPAGFGAGHDLSDGRGLLARVLPPELSEALLPLAIVDEASLACTVLTPLSDGERMFAPGTVIRLFLSSVDIRHQLAPLDIDPLLYIASLEEELTARGTGLDRILDEIGPAYEQAYIEHAKRPRDFILRPIRLACQNVIVALAAIAQDSTFDGLSVAAWQTCEVPHVATHEGNRALAALMLCDAFARGGTMEIRFDRPASITLDGRPVRYAGHPETRVPASLRRYGRTVDVLLGTDDPAAISPREARELFLAITPMPEDLRGRISNIAIRRGIAPERACYALLSQVWREIELDMLLATSEHAASILAGGADWTHRSQRQSESDACRAALLAGMYFRRLNGRDNAAATADGVRLVEDVSGGVSWTIHEADATVTYRLPTPTAPPWAPPDAALPAATALTVVPRVRVSEHDEELVRASIAAGTPAALLVPGDTLLPTPTVPVLRCPDRLDDLDRTIEDKLLTSRISRG
jgi:hypothetical protein